ncbi:MAG: hypothetical protein J5781_07130 [Clostridia bacterium]|nr:hypothetical protein [Clostridia bacterium]
MLPGVVERKSKEEETARLVKEYTDNKLATYARENAENAEYEVVFLGDSLTDGCDLSKYYGEYVASNRGIGGDTSFGLLDRMQVSAYDAHPKTIVLLIGGNDILRGRSLESIYSNYEKIIAGIHEHLPDTKIVWCSLSALGNQWAKHNDTVVICNQKIKLLAQKYGCEFVDIYTPLCDVETDEIREEYTAEGVHFTDEGYKVVSAKIKEKLRNILGH